MFLRRIFNPLSLRAPLAMATVGPSGEPEPQSRGFTERCLCSQPTAMEKLNPVSQETRRISVQKQRALCLGAKNGSGASRADRAVQRIPNRLSLPPLRHDAQHPQRGTQHRNREREGV